MTFRIEQIEDFSVVHFNGEVDLSRSPEARRAILSCLQNRHHLLVDMSAVDYIDSSGVATLVEGYQVSRSQNLAFALIGVSDAAMNVLRLARLDHVFPIYRTLQEGLNSKGNSA